MAPTSPEEEACRIAMLEWLNSDAAEMPAHLLEIQRAASQVRAERLWAASAEKGRVSEVLAAERRMRAERIWRDLVSHQSVSMNGGSYGVNGMRVELGGTLDAIAEALEGDPRRAAALFSTTLALADEVPF